MTYLKVNGLDYWLNHEGQGEPLLLLHGFTGSSLNWQDHADVFKQNFRTITIDLIGHGKTAVPPNRSRYEMESAAQDIEEIMNQLSLAPVHLLGYSMGGRLALYIAATRPYLIHSLILESASAGLDSAEAREHRIEQDNQLADWIEQHDIEAFIEKWTKLPLFASQHHLSPTVRNKLWNQRIQNNPPGLANSLRGMGTGKQPSLWLDLPELSCPTLLLAGELDSKFVGINQRMVGLIPKGKLLIIPDAGHTIHLERSEIFRNAVIEFIKTLNREQLADAK